MRLQPSELCTCHLSGVRGAVCAAPMGLCNLCVKRPSKAHGQEVPLCTGAHGASPEIFLGKARAGLGLGGPACSCSRALSGLWAFGCGGPWLALGFRGVGVAGSDLRP